MLELAAVLAVIVAILAAVTIGSDWDPRFAAPALLSLAVWGGIIFVNVKRLGILKGAAMILLVHLVMLASLLGFLGALIAVLFLVLEAADERTVRPSVIVAAAVCAGLFLLGQVTERKIARVCIRDYLNRPTQRQE